MTLKAGHRGNVTEYALLLALVGGVSTYGLQSLGPALSGNFKQVDNVGTLSLLAPWNQAGGGPSAGKPGNDPGAIPDNPKAGLNPPSASTPGGIEQLLENPGEISQLPDYAGGSGAALGDKGISLKPDKQTGPQPLDKPTLNPGTPLQPPKEQITGTVGGAIAESEPAPPIMDTLEVKFKQNQE